MKLRYSPVILILLAFAQAAFAASDAQIRSLFEDGNKLYDAHNYREAIERYTDITDEDVRCADVFFNLGDAYYKAGDIGRAILNMERARLLDPGDPDIRCNLDFLTSQTQDKIAPPPKSFLEQVVSFFRTPFTNRTTLYLVVAFFWLMFAAGGRLLFRPRKRMKTIAWICLFTSFFLFVVFSASLGIRSWKAENLRYAVVLETSVQAYSGPGADYTNVFTLHAGTKLRIHRAAPGWFQISLVNGLSGWLPADALEEI